MQQIGEPLNVSTSSDMVRVFDIEKYTIPVGKYNLKLTVQSIDNPLTKNEFISEFNIIPTDIMGYIEDGDRISSFK